MFHNLPIQWNVSLIEVTQTSLKYFRLKLGVKLTNWPIHEYVLNDIWLDTWIVYLYGIYAQASQLICEHGNRVGVGMGLVHASQRLCLWLPPISISSYTDIHHTIITCHIITFTICLYWFMRQKVIFQQCTDLRGVFFSMLESVHLVYMQEKNGYNKCQWIYF